MTARTPLAPLPALLLLLVLAPAPARAAGWAWIDLPDGARLRAEVMQTPEERRHGLMGRDALPDDRLMLFSYDADGVHRVWMKDCKFPIDVAWVAADGTVAAVAEGLPPCAREPCPVYGPDAPTRHFVEGNAGWLKARGVGVGTRLGVGAVRDGP